MRHLASVLIVALLAVILGPSVGAEDLIVEPDPSPDSGFSSSLEVNSLGNPVVVYFDRGNGDLKMLVCGNPDCTAGNTVTSVATDSDSGFKASLALRADDRPVIAYQRWFPTEFRLLQCGNPTCTSGNESQVIDTAFNAGEYSSIAIDSIGRPSVAYSTNALGVRLFACGDATCTSGNQTTMADTTYNTGNFVSMVFDALDRPIMSYWNKAEADLKVLACGNRNCTAGNRYSTPATLGNTGQATSIVLDADGRPAIAYMTLQGFGDSDISVLRCGDRACLGGNTITTFSGIGTLWGNDALELAANGHPRVVFQTDDNALGLLACGNETCGGGESELIALDDAQGGADAAIELGPDGNPVFSYIAWPNGSIQLRVLTCDDPICDPLAVEAPTSSIGLANYIDGVADLGDGRWQVDYVYVIENLGADTLDEIVLTNDFDATFTGATVESGPSPNGGTCDTEVAAFPGHTLEGGASCTAIWQVVIADVPEGTYLNTATVAARNAGGVQVTDISDFSFVSDANGNGNANEPGENDPTPLTFAFPPPPSGDANCDDLVDIIDALVIAQYVATIRTDVVDECAGTLGATEIKLSESDVNVDGVTDIIDALLVAQCSAGLFNVLCEAPAAD